MFSEVTAHIYTDALLHNLRTMRGLLGPRVRFCAALKANAYGHGVDIVAPVLAKAGVEMAAVAQLDEGIALRRLGWEAPILVFGHVLGGVGGRERRTRIEAALAYELALTLVEDGELLQEIDAVARREGRVLDLHLKIDTGMGRMGLSPANGLTVLEEAARLAGVRLAGVYSHFATADEADEQHARQQIAAFDHFLARAAAHLPSTALRHMANSAGTIRFPAAHYDIVRVGLALYGYHTSDATRARVTLRPCMRVESRITEVKWLPPGHCVGYGCTVWTKRRTRIGIVPAGYGDGIRRALSNVGIIGTATGDAPILGRISMDQFAVDLTDLPAVISGTPVVLLDEHSSRPNSVESVSNLLSTISYEITCGLSTRVERAAAAVDDPAQSQQKRARVGST